MCISASLPLTLSKFVIHLSNFDFLEEAFTFSEFKCCLQNDFLTLEIISQLPFQESGLSLHSCWVTMSGLLSFSKLPKSQTKL